MTIRSLPMLAIYMALLFWTDVYSSPIDLEELEVVLRDLMRSEERSERELSRDLGLTSLVERGLQSRPVTVSAFNVRMFGDKKYADKTVRELLIKIFGRYDITLMQEIRDGNPPDSFLGFMVNLTDAYGSEMNYVLSERLGRTNSKEQYAYVYNSSVLSVADTYTYEDKDDHFERPPYCVHFTSTKTAVPDFAIIGIHTKPSKAEEEISYLVDVYEEVVKRFDTQNVIIMGDFNADCSYVTGGEWSTVGLRTDSRFSWLINDTADTTVANSECAYDRFVIAGEDMKQAIVPGSARPFRYDLAYQLDKDLTERVSDHYPIQLEIYGAVVPDVKATKAQECLTITSPKDATDDIMSMLTGSKPRTYRYFAYFKPSIVTKGSRSWAELERTEDCNKVVARLDALKKQRPELMANVAVAMVEADASAILSGPPPSVPGLILQELPSAAAEKCLINIQYDGPHYDIKVCKRIQ